MNDRPIKDRGALIMAIMVVAGFFGLVTIILIGLVDIANPEMAKLVGLVVGYLTGLVTPVVMSYFKGGTDGN